MERPEVVAEKQGLLEDNRPQETKQRDPVTARQAGNAPGRLAVRLLCRPEAVELLRGARHAPEKSLWRVDPVDHALVVRQHVASRPQGLEVEPEDALIA